MIAIHFWTTTKGDLTHLSYIFLKPEPLGTEFNTVACSVTGDFFSIEINRGKEGINKRKYYMDLRKMEAFTKMMV